MSKQDARRSSPEAESLNLAASLARRWEHFEHAADMGALNMAGRSTNEIQPLVETHGDLLLDHIDPLDDPDIAVDRGSHPQRSPK